MELISVEFKTIFVEKRVSEYALAEVGHPGGGFNDCEFRSEAS